MQALNRRVPVPCKQADSASVKSPRLRGPELESASLGQPSFCQGKNVPGSIRYNYICHSSIQKVTAKFPNLQVSQFVFYKFGM